MRSLIATCCLIAVAVASALNAGPSQPLAGVCHREGVKAVDQNNMCWYHECVLDAYGTLSWMPRKCGWMTKVSYNYVEGLHNPCTVNLMDSAGAYSGNMCEREAASFNGAPSCHPTYCYNGGTPVYESNMCWCECPPSWQGDHDCSKPTLPYQNLPPSSNICVHGIPEYNWCEMYGGCLNGGTCYNQCDTFWCDCGEYSALHNDHVGKKCEVK